MHCLVKQILLVLAFANVLAALASHPVQGSAQQRRHQHHTSARTEGELFPRGPNSRWSWYNTEESGNPGACGRHIKNSDFAVARPLREFRFATDCFKQVTLTFEGRTAVATVLDACEKCPPNGLDLSQGLFKFIAPHGDGIVHGSWSWGAKAVEPEKSKTTTPKPQLPKTSTTTNTRASITRLTTAPTSASFLSSSSATSSATSSSSTSTVSFAVPTPITFYETNNLAEIQDVLVRFGDFVVASSQEL